MKIPVYKNNIEYKENNYSLQALFSDVAYYMSYENNLGIFMDGNDLNKKIHEDNNDDVFNEIMARYFQKYDELYESSSIDNEYGDLLIEKISRVKNMPIKNMYIELAKDFIEDSDGMEI